MIWRIIVSGKTDPYLNMAIDEAIYLNVSNNLSPPTIRFYDWEPSSFSFGYNQNLEKELDIDKVKQSPYKYVRRPTGGRLVLHDNEVTYSVIAPISNKMAGSLMNSYLRIGRALQIGFKLSGIILDLSDKVLSSAHQREYNNPCFSSSSQYELTYERKKLVGSAQVRNNKALLQHGSILMTNNQQNVGDYLPNISDEESLRIKAYLGRRTTTVNDILGHSVSYYTMVNWLIEGFKNEWNEDSFTEQNSLSEKEKNTINHLYNSKYISNAWNDCAVFNKKILTHNQ